MSTLVDWLRVGFLRQCGGADLSDDDEQAGQQLAHDHGRPADELVYGVVHAGLRAMALRAVQVALIH
jgi:hypothetical protein